jgi:sulfur carrier protein ThiS
MTFKENCNYHGQPFLVQEVPMRVLYNKKIWSFGKELSVDELLNKLNIEIRQVVVLADGKKMEKNDNISKEASVVIVENVRGG